MLSREELIRKLNELSENTSSEEARILFDDLSDYLNDAYDGPEPWDDDEGDVTPEYAAWEKKALEDLGVDESIFDTLNSLIVPDNPVTSKAVIDKDNDGDADVTVIKQDDGNDDDESLVIGGTDIFKEPFSEEQLAILRGDDDYNKFSKDEFDSLQAADYSKARTARKAWIKRARELLDGNDDDESLIIGGTDIFKEPFTEEQLAILRNDGDFTKFSTDEFNALQAADHPKARKARDAWIKRARELLEGESSDKPHDEDLVAKPGEHAPDSDNFTNDIARTLASKRW